MIQLQSASAIDMPLIAELAEYTWNIHYPPIIGQAQVDYMLAKFYSQAALNQQFEAGQQFYLVLENEKAIGYLSVSETVPNDFFLHKFYINPSQQGKGIGAQVFDQLMALYPSASTIRLTVNRQNYKSINFYFKVGFIIEKVLDIAIGDGYEMNDFQMLKKLK